MGQNNKFLAKNFFVPNCQIFAENDENQLKLGEFLRKIKHKNLFTR
jgi:hypothetical protein